MGNGLLAKNGGTLTAKDCRIFNNGLNGLKLNRAAPQCIAVNCYIHHNVGAGIDVWYSKDVSLIGNNVFSNNESGINAMGSEVVIRENDIFDNPEWGIWSRNDSSVIVTMNRVSRNKSGGIHVGYGVQGEKVSPSVIQQNKIYDNNGEGLVKRCEDDGQPPKFLDNEIYNNKENENNRKLNLSILCCSNCRKRCELTKCGKCFTTSYCSKTCQKKQWSKHKKICKVLREKLSYVVTNPKKAEYSEETESIEGSKDVGPKFSPPPPRDGKMFVAKVHTADRETGSHKVILYDRSLELYVKFDSKLIDQLLIEFGVLCESRTFLRRLFFHCLFDDHGKMRLFTNEFAEFLNW